MQKKMFMNLAVAASFLYVSSSLTLKAETKQKNDSVKQTVDLSSAIFMNPSISRTKRIDDLISRLTIAEKTSFLVAKSSGVPRLGILPYHSWNECLHGVARAGLATVFPQAIGLASMWDDSFINEIAKTVSTEARAKYNEAQKAKKYGRYTGLTFWTPNINLFRDPRWGRGQETYGEDPYLSGRLGVEFIKGLQGSDPDYLKLCACAKHFAVHNGPEPERHVFDVSPSSQDLYESYLPQFEMAIKEGNVQSVMGAYNRVFGVPACASQFLLQKLLRDDWGFTGHVVSDCGAIKDIWHTHKVTKSPASASALAIKAGCDLNCGSTYRAVPQAIKEGILTEKDVDKVLRRVLEVRFNLGMFDPKEMSPWSRISNADIDTPANKKLALKAARKSIVLLTNDKTLPLNLAKIKKIAVIGPNAHSVPVLLGNYNGQPSAPVTILDGIKQACSDKIEVTYTAGCPMALSKGKSVKDANAKYAADVNKAKDADVIIFVGGIDAGIEGEEMRSASLIGFNRGDRTDIELPITQLTLLKKLKTFEKPVILVNCSGSAMAMPWEAKNLNAIIQAWYPGQAGGTAVADILFGKYNPSGCLPVTFYNSTKDLPPFPDYSMQNRTYRFFKQKPLFAFGHGLSYTTFKYSALNLLSDQVSPTGEINLTVKVTNTGSVDGGEVVQIYAVPSKKTAITPSKTLVAFKSVNVKAGETVLVSLKIPTKRLALWNTKLNKMAPQSAYTLHAASASDDFRLEKRIQIKK